MTPAAGTSPAGPLAGPVALTITTRRGDAHVLMEEPPARAAAAAGHTGTPAFVLALTHAAGGGVGAPDLLAARDAALDLGGTVARVTQPYRVRGARAPGPAARQDEAWVELITALRSRMRAPGVPFIQGGRSNGARVACRTACAVGADAVIALAFPLRPPAHPERSRRGELLAAGVPVLAVSGGRDPFGVPRSADAAKVVVLATEGHALAGNPAAVRTAVCSWLRERLPCSG